MASSPVTTPFLFAQLCKELTPLEISDATIFNLYRDISGGVRSPWLLSINDFVLTFYPRQGNFALNCDISSVEVDSVRWQYLSNWDYEPGGNSPTGTTGGLFDVSFNLVGAVEGQWASDINVPVDCWSACSLLRITQELLKANYICNLKCNVCCSLCSYELAEALNSISNASSNTLNQYSPRNARQPVLLGDRLALSVLFTNPNIGVRPIDLRLHFNVFFRDTWRYASAAAVTVGVGPPATEPATGLWLATVGGVVTLGINVATNGIRINAQAFCSGMNYIEFSSINLVGRRIYIDGGVTAGVAAGLTCPYGGPRGLSGSTANYSITSQTFVSSGNYIELGIGDFDLSFGGWPVVQDHFSAITIV